ncbi:transcriptional regulator [Pedobacter yulinensis]|uniref:Transcriptional regulator n=1 Tax=Pedobacter yulinensis TaxID=2126353 RepID=A0A2T3HKC7_9SPHI|nr:GntR family transcriptional regulator [Pedobacter yulinensis]PST82880.1 transcriptional regulator [Pedobacter yulinensis]
MKPEQSIQFLSVDDYSATPKYMQLCNSVVAAIESGKLKKDDMLPSINELSFQLEISRDTAEKGYRYLKKIGILASVPGKGYYICNDAFKQKLRVFLLFNKLSYHKKLIYDAFIEALGDGVTVDFYIYNNDFALFKKLLTGRAQDYSHLVIIPHFIDGDENAVALINALPKNKLVILDKKLPGIDGQYAAVYENFEKDIYGALEQARERLSKYHTIKIIFPKRSYFPVEILRGFYRFCQQYAFEHSVISKLDEEPIAKGEVYINLMEDDLVLLVERVMAQGLEMGRDVGVISYNETPLKKIIASGITTLSTDFGSLGRRAAQLILKHSTDHVEVPFSLTLRPSL